MAPPDSDYDDDDDADDGSDISGETHLTQDTRIAGIDTPLGKDVLVLRGMTATEAMGRLPTFELDLLSEQQTLDPKDLLGKPVSIWLNVLGGKKRYFHGYVVQFGRTGVTSRFFAYQAVVAPWMWFLTRTRNCRIFQNLSVRDIIEKIFKEHGFPYTPRLTGDYTTWEYCVQYRESDFDFVSRLMEQEGIYYYYSYEENENTLVLADSEGAHDPMPGYDSIDYRPPGAGTAGEEVREHIREFVRQMNHVPGTFTHTDYNFETPQADLRTSSTAPGDYPQSHLEIYDYPGEYEKHGEGEDWARARLEEITAEAVVYTGWGDTRGLGAGCCFELVEPPDPGQAGQYLVTSAKHTLNTGQFEVGNSDERPVYDVHFEVQPLARIFRAGRDTEKPFIRGLQTAVVTGPAGEEIYTDNYGRVKVQFHWDREGKQDENTTCFVRVASLWAGRRWGATFTPRIGQEVVIAFLEGDPDEPLIIGSVPNGQQMPPYLGSGPDPEHPDEKNISGIKSCSTKGGQGYNEWRFNDTKGKEQIFFHAEKDLDTRVKNDTRTDVAGNVHLRVGYPAQGESAPSGAGHVTEKILHTKTTHAQESIVEFADQSRSAVVGTNGEYRERIDSGGNFSAQAQQTFSIKAGTVLIEAGPEGQISLQCGASFIVLKPEGIYINGPMLYLNSGGGGTGALAVSLPSPPEPDLADNAKPGSISGPSNSGTPGSTPSGAHGKTASPTSPASGSGSGGGGGSGGSASPSLDNIAKGVNPLKGQDNCGYIVRAVHDRFYGTKPDATAPDATNGTFEELEETMGTKLQWGSSFGDAFDAVREGGDGTTALVGIKYADSDTSHVVMLANRNGDVGIVEGQLSSSQDGPVADGGGMVFRNRESADAYYNPTGRDDIGYGITTK